MESLASCHSRHAQPLKPLSKNGKWKTFKPFFSWQQSRYLNSYNIAQTNKMILLVLVASSLIFNRIFQQISNITRATRSKNQLVEGSISWIKMWPHKHSQRTPSQYNHPLPDPMPMQWIAFFDEVLMWAPSTTLCLCLSHVRIWSYFGRLDESIVGFNSETISDADENAHVAPRLVIATTVNRTLIGKYLHHNIKVHNPSILVSIVKETRFWWIWCRRYN